MVGLVAVALIAGGLVWIFSPKATTSTDDAYVQGDKTIVSPKVRGMVTAIDARENRRVAAGDLLVTLDPEEYDLKIAQGQGDLMAAQAAERTARAGLASLDAEEKVTEGAVNSAEQAAGSTPRPTRLSARRSRPRTARRWSPRAPVARSWPALSEAVAAEYRAKTELEAARLQKAETQVKAPAAGTVADIQTNVGAAVQPGSFLQYYFQYALCNRYRYT